MFHYINAQKTGNQYAVQWWFKMLVEIGGFGAKGGLSKGNHDQQPTIALE